MAITKPSGLGERGRKARRRVARVDLWQRYRESGDAKARDELLRLSLRWVDQAARTILRRRKRRLSFEDLLSAGTIGLVEALERFDPDAGVSFHYFAAQRIRGSMLDALRKERRLSRTLLEKRRRVRQARARLAQQHGRRPHEAAVAEALDMPLPEYWGLLQALNREVVVPFPPEEAGPQKVIGAQIGPDQEDPLQRVIEEERAERLRRALHSLCERDQLILSLYFFDGLLLREIGDRLGVTEGRVCQLQQRALRRLRARWEAGEAQGDSEGERMVA